MDANFPLRSFSCRPDLFLSSSLGLISCSDEDEFEMILDKVEVDLDFITQVFKVCRFNKTGMFSASHKFLDLLSLKCPSPTVQF